ncbi:MAG: 3-hydroxyacyl-CoA dehydrogenase family protein [Candidatus Xenobia bacterium]
MQVEQVAVIGAGTMGNGIAQAFAQSGLSVKLVDVQQSLLDAALAKIGASLEKLAGKGKITAETRQSALQKIQTATSLDAVVGCQLVIEAVTENLEVKRQIFREVDKRLSPDALIASNTSSISITTLAAATSRPTQVLGMHFMNPVPLMPLVELIRGEATRPEAMATAVELCKRLGKTPVEAEDYPGFISNRILMPMINEAVFARMEGVGSAEAIDTVMKLGMNHPMGPLELADFIGLDVCLAIMDVLHEGLGDDKYRACPLLRRMVSAGHLGRKSGQGFYNYQKQEAAVR